MKRKSILFIAILSAIIALLFMGYTNGAAERDRINNLERERIQKQEKIDDIEKSLKDLELKFNDSEKQKQDQQKQIEDLNKQLSAKKAEQARIVAAQRIGGNCEVYRSIFNKYDWNVNVAMAIMNAESGCRPNAVSPTNDHGLMQINQGLALYGQSIYDPEFNIRIAYTEKYLKGGWRHWSVYNSGAYLKYLS